MLKTIDRANSVLARRFRSAFLALVACIGFNRVSSQEFPQPPPSIPPFHLLYSDPGAAWGLILQIDKDGNSSVVSQGGLLGPSGNPNSIALNADSTSLFVANELCLAKIQIASGDQTKICDVI